MSKLFDLVSEIEIPSIYSICCSSRRKHTKIEKILEQEKAKNQYLTQEVKIVKDALIESYIELLDFQQKKLAIALEKYNQIHKQFEQIKDYKQKNKLSLLSSYIITTIENVEDDWKKIENSHYELLEIEMKKFEILETKIKIVSNSI